jgi:hypothetical protein
MSKRACRQCQTKQTGALAVLALLALCGCSSTGDLGRLNPAPVDDYIHAWVGEAAAARVGAPVSAFNLTEDELTLRDLAFPLIEPPYDRQRWDQVVYEWGDKHSFQKELWNYNPTSYYIHLQNYLDRSTATRYSRIIDDIRNDIVRLEPFYAVARRVADLDRRRAATMAEVTDLGPAERYNAQARIAENSLVIAWVNTSLSQRCASYRFAIEHLAIAEPAFAAGEADRLLTELTQQIAAYHVDVIAAPRYAYASAPAVVVAQRPRRGVPTQ